MSGSSGQKWAKTMVNENGVKSSCRVQTRANEYIRVHPKENRDILQGVLSWLKTVVIISETCGGTGGVTAMPATLNLERGTTGPRKLKQNRTALIESSALWFPSDSLLHDLGRWVLICGNDNHG